MHLHALYHLMPTKPGEVNNITSILASRRLRPGEPMVKQILRSNTHIHLYLT